MRLPSSPHGGSIESIWTGGDDLDQSKAGLDGLKDAVRRLRALLFAWVGFCLIVASVYARTTTPEYLASVQLVLRGGHKAQDGPDGSSLSHQLELSGAAIETQLAIIRSPGFLRPLFGMLQLDAAPTGVDTPEAAKDPTGAEDAPRPHDNFDAFRSRVGARRVGISTTFEVSYQAPDAAQAVRGANAIAAAYVHDRIRTAMVDTRAFTPYLKTRIAAIMTQAAVAAEAVRKGGLPSAEFVDADVRLLGPARMPLAPAYPRLGPIVMFAIGFGLISGLLLVAAIHAADRTIRSRAQLRDGFGFNAFALAMEHRGQASQAVFAVLSTAIGPWLASGHEVHGQAGARQRVRAIGLLSWTDSPALPAIGTGLADAMARDGFSARLVDPETGTSGPAVGGAAAGALAATLTRLPGGAEEVAIVALPAVSTSFTSHAVLPLLDAAVVIVLAGQTTYAELRRVLRAMGEKVPLAAVVLVEPTPARRGTAGGPWPRARHLAQVHSGR